MFKASINKFFSFKKCILFMVCCPQKLRLYCCNLSGGVALVVCFTTNKMCVKNNTIIYVARASSSKTDCDVVALPILTCERLNMMTSLCEERLRAWSLLLLAATVRRFAHMPLGVSNRIKMVLWPGCGGRAEFRPSHKERAICVVRCKKEGMLLQPLRWCCVDCVIHHQQDVREK